MHKLYFVRFVLNNLIFIEYKLFVLKYILIIIKIYIDIKKDIFHNIY